MSNTQIEESPMYIGATAASLVAAQAFKSPLVAPRFRPPGGSDTHTDRRCLCA